MLSSWAPGPLQHWDPSKNDVSGGCDSNYDIVQMLGLQRRKLQLPSLLLADDEGATALAEG